MNREDIKNEDDLTAYCLEYGQMIFVRDDNGHVACLADLPEDTVARYIARWVREGRVPYHAPTWAEVDRMTAGEAFESGGRLSEEILRGPPEEAGGPPQ